MTKIAEVETVSGAVGGFWLAFSFVEIAGREGQLSALRPALNQDLGNGVRSRTVRRVRLNWSHPVAS